MLEKLLKALPFSGKVSELLPYYYEAKFFNFAKKFKQDKNLLGARIRKKAHLLDKDLTVFDGICHASAEKKLEELIEEWNAQNFGNNDASIKWAERILEKHKITSGKIRGGKSAVK